MFSAFIWTQTQVNFISASSLRKSHLKRATLTQNWTEFVHIFLISSFYDKSNVLYHTRQQQDVRCASHCFRAASFWFRYTLVNFNNSNMKPNSEASFLFSTFKEFFKCWRSGAKCRVFIESVNGKAIINFSTILGYPDDVHFKPWQSKRNPSKGPRKK